jgi:antitoxin component of MazEF toxin-antitoxin module
MNELRDNVESGASKPRYTLEELVAAITPENVHPEIETGPDVGREVLEDCYARQNDCTNSTA